MKQKHEMTFYQFSREMVEHGDFSHFLERFAPDKLPRGKHLAKMKGSLSFFVDGYNNDQRELYEIEEVRTFYSRLFDAWPYWLYFCTLETESLAMMVACRIANLKSFKLSGATSVKVELSLEDMTLFLSQAFGPMNSMFEQAWAPDTEIMDHTDAVMRYFHLPTGLVPR
jgi:hypothetical protein